MKFLKILFLFIIFLLDASLGKAQQDVNIQFTVTNASAPGACDGTMDIQCIGCPSSVTYTWYDTSTTPSYPLPEVIGTGNHITGLCVNFNYCYSVIISDGITCQSRIFASIKDASVAGTTFQLNTNLNYGNDSTIGHITIQQVLGGFSPYWYSLYDYHDDLSPFGKIVIDTNLTQINNVTINDSILAWHGHDDLRLRVGDSKSNFIAYDFTIFYDTISCNTGPKPLSLSAQGYPVSDSTLCDGRGYAIAYGGTSPYSYSFSSGATDSTESGLCPGYYLVTVTDSLSNTVSTTFIVGLPGTVYFSDPGSLTYIDTLYSNASQNCGLDYSMPIDSFYVDTSYSLCNMKYVVKWIVVQDTNTFDFTEVYNVDITGNYMFGLSVYCNQRSSTFGSFSFFAGLHVIIPSATTRVIELKDDTKITLYPNPNKGTMQLKYELSNHQKAEFIIYDVTGRKVADYILQEGKNTLQINETDLQNGIYYYSVIVEGKVAKSDKLIIIR